MTGKNALVSGFPRHDRARSAGRTFAPKDLGLRLMLLVAGVLLGATPLRAAEPIQNPSQFTPGFLAFLKSDAHRRALYDKAREQNARLPGSCPTVVYSLPGVITFFEPVTTDADGTPTQGVWAEAVDAAGCGMTRRYNIVTLAPPGKPLRTEAMLPGTTKADPLLQRDSLAQVYEAMTAATNQRDCKNVAITDTRFEAYEGGPVKNAKSGPNARPWRELWTLWACGRIVEVPLHFVPDEKGTAIRVSAQEVKLRK
jgi:hypothetical protein